jgi:glyoxylase-like metal-dependent hydrolase (beta-lactamase superfamily II)
MRRRLGIFLCLALLCTVAWLWGREAREPAAGWKEVAPGVFRSPGVSAGYALVSGEHALLIDAPVSPDEQKVPGVKTIEQVLLTHHHRDLLHAVGGLLAHKVAVRAPKESAPWLKPEGVARYWRESLPLRNSRTAYLVVAEGFPEVDCSLAEGEAIDWRGWTVRVVASPGASPDHLAFAVRRGKTGPLLLFCGDALAAPGKLWAPYTTDWDHWTDAGLKPTAESLRKLARLSPDVVLPAHGPVIRTGTVAALEQTAEAVAEVGFLKSFERYSKERRKNPPKYNFLVKEQAGSNGSKPWSRISRHLWVTGNTYVLASDDGPCLVVDPWDPHSAKQIPLLQGGEKLGKVEVVLCSHAHFDHYDGAYTLLERDRPDVWTLDAVAVPVADPFLLRAPFLDVRPLKIHRRLKDGETAVWREYQFRFRFLPGQTEYTMGVETTIDGKKCFFTADNFFHHDLFSGTGGWMGLNRSGPLLYEASARKVLEARPDWVLAEHGSAMEFNAEDFQRRVDWGKEGAKAAHAVCPSGDYRKDWNPHRIHVEPLVQKARAGETVKGTLVVSNPLGWKEQVRVVLEGRGRTPDQTWDVEVGAGAEVRRPITLALEKSVAVGRQVLPLRAEGDASDAFVVVDVE